MYKEQKKRTSKRQAELLSQIVVQQNFINEQQKKIAKKYEFPASLKNARVHAKAVKVGYKLKKIQKAKKSRSTNVNSNYDEDNEKKQFGRPKLCPCCNKTINTSTIPVFYSTTNPDSQQKPFLLNSGNAMFFSFIKMSILYLFLVFLFCDAFNVVISGFGNYCFKRHLTLDCELNFFSLLSAYNRYDDRNIQAAGKFLDILCLFVVVGSIIFFTIYRKVQFDLYDKIDHQFQTQDDYSLFVQNIPILDFTKQMRAEDYVQFDYEQKLKQIFEDQIKNWLNYLNEDSTRGGVLENHFMKTIQQKQKTIYDLNNEHKITTISLCFDLTELQKVRKQRNQLMEKQIQSYKEESKNQNYVVNTDNLSSVRNQIKVLNNIQVDLCEDYATNNSPVFNITHFAGKAFVSFQYEHYRQYLLQKYEEDSNKYKYGQTNQPLILSRATYPTDIHWQNMNISDSQRTGKVAASYLILLMILIFGAFFLILIDILKKQNIKKDSGSSHSQIQIVAINYGLNALASLLTFLLNKGLGYVTIKLNDFERHKTRTNQYTSLVVKLVVTQFLNTAFIFYLIQLLTPRPYLSSAGLVVQISTLIIVSGFIQIVTNAIHIPMIMRYINLYWHYGAVGLKQHGEALIPTFQNKLNKDYELPIFDMTGRYAYYVVHVYTCLYYSYLIPLGVLGTAIIFAIQYWIDKIKMINYSSEYYEMDYFLSRTILKMFQVGLLIFAIGNLVFSIVIHHQYDISQYIFNLISIGIALAYVLFIYLAPTALQRRIFAKYETFEKDSYDQCLKNDKFVANYWTQNPGTVFVKQIDINRQGQYVDQGQCDQYFNADDIVQQTLQSNIFGQNNQNNTQNQYGY